MGIDQIGREAAVKAFGDVGHTAESLVTDMIRAGRVHGDDILALSKHDGTNTAKSIGILGRVKQFFVDLLDAIKKVFSKSGDEVDNVAQKAGEDVANAVDPKDARIAELEEELKGKADPVDFNKPIEPPSTVLTEEGRLQAMRRTAAPVVEARKTTLEKLAKWLADPSNVNNTSEEEAKQLAAALLANESDFARLTNIAAQAGSGITRSELIALSGKTSEIMTKFVKSRGVSGGKATLERKVKELLAAETKLIAQNKAKSGIMIGLTESQARNEITQELAELGVPEAEVKKLFDAIDTLAAGNEAPVMSAHDAEEFIKTEFDREMQKLGKQVKVADVKARVDARKTALGNQRTAAELTTDEMKEEFDIIKKSKLTTEIDKLVPLGTGLSDRQFTSLVSKRTDVETRIGKILELKARHDATPAGPLKDSLQTELTRQKDELKGILPKPATGTASPDIDKIVSDLEKEFKTIKDGVIARHDTSQSEIQQVAIEMVAANNVHGLANITYDADLNKIFFNPAFDNATQLQHFYELHPKAGIDFQPGDNSKMANAYDTYVKQLDTTGRSANATYKILDSYVQEAISGATPTP